MADTKLDEKPQATVEETKVDDDQHQHAAAPDAGPTTLQPDITTTKTEDTTRPSTATTAATRTEEPSPAKTDDLEKPKSIRRKPVPSSIIDIDTTTPQDFEGEVLTNNELPTPETLKKIEDYIVLDRDGKSHTFKTLYSGSNVARRVLVLFVRHFFCGNCQEYIRTLSEAISPDSLLALPISTFIVIVGCGDPALIEMYAKETNCRFPIYTDPKRSIFNAMGMNQTLAMGSKPAYMRRPMSTSIVASIGQALRSIPSGLTLKSGNHRQVGGEFLFEPLDIVTPVTTPYEERHKPIGETEDGKYKGPEAQQEDPELLTRVEEKKVTWCHRMKTTRDHCEIPELMEVLGLDGQGAPLMDQKRWADALQKRKGTGVSMAKQMSELSEERQRERERAGSLP